MNAARSSEARRDSLRDRAARINDAFGLVLALVLLTYVLTSLLDQQGWHDVIVTASVGLTSVVALIASHVGARIVWGGAVVALVAIACASVAALDGDRGWLNASSLLGIGLLAVAMAAVLRRVLTTAEIGFRTILGALSFYAVLGILFGFAYSTISRIQGGEFFAGVPEPHGEDFLFFSYTTLTTTGYGNLVPAGQPGQMLAGLEMMLGQIFLVTLVAGLVSLWRPGEVLRGHSRRPPQG